MPANYLIAESVAEFAFDPLLAKRPATTVETRSRAVGGWALLVIRRLEKPVGPEAVEVMTRLVELALADVDASLRRLQAELTDRRAQ